jgi:hypothetical protein
LLECLIQIKALREALRAGTRADDGGTSPEMGPVAVSGVWQRMAEAERRYAMALGTDIAGGAETAPSDDGPGASRDRFVAWRGANLAILDRCTAAELAGFVEWPGRPATTVADLVAIMLANDTEALGGLRGTRPKPVPPRSN